MKKNDILIIVVVAIVAGVFSFVVAGMLFGGNKKYTLTAPTIKPISAEFNTDSIKPYINSDSLDITKDITVQNNANNQPFKENKQ